ncbi:LLM class flavin-dependent oxidoreductase [Jiangella mangrovi]|uniref:Alkanesulfonate monooxygenase SsuD/methylene tetrahydromethanopterin reductase-like flavin-dependent oxidoreductase (Luciferase family) n=1 Tax=Jiangella mangrovi TaxID=1524084 RepID=A0A7W9LJS1_9ACTN|nr:LLM class flavin-dependent oxidoreductase [Jiangella mangrovi]MBB5786342.1 alkanesulfonate monooxygenase SsuD/methylene tetrahydromethanopterin reductase-like flavin-dependent oxidoreductase (luciferase family) [Jiangella mangrovi]
MTTTAIEFGAALPASAKRLPELLEATTIAEELGAGLVTVADHPYLPSELDAWTLVPLLLARTSRVRVATNVTALPFRSPTVIAKAAATLQFTSGGRFVLGLGAGGPYDGLPGWGAQWGSLGQAIGALDEAIPLLRRLWSGHRVDHDGEFYRLREAVAVAGAPPDPVPPVWVGAFKSRMLALTGRHADGWLPTNAYLSLDEVPAMQRAVDAAAVAAGRDPSAIRRVFNVMGVIDDDQARRNDQLLVGPAAHWAEALTDYRERLGFETFVFWPVRGDTRRQVELFFETVVPKL